jgi:predicted O-methyltransferase YrrM
VKEELRQKVVSFKNPNKDPLETREFYELILSYSAVFTPDGQYRRLHSHTRPLEHATIRDALLETKAKHTLEVGFAYGTSALIFAEYHQSKNHTAISHTIIDPNQFGKGEGYWEGIGAENLKRVGFIRGRQYRLIEDTSIRALPALFNKFGPEWLDVAFIDGWHTFDYTLMDIFFCLEMLKVGGILIVDDKRLKAITAVTNYVKRAYPHIVDICPKDCKSHLVLKKVSKDTRDWDSDEKVNFNLS